MYRPEFIRAPVTIKVEQVYDTEVRGSFVIEGFCHGIVEFTIDVNPKIKTLIQLTATDFTYTAFYASRHGNLEVYALLYPLLNEKLSIPMKECINTLSKGT